MDVDSTAEGSAGRRRGRTSSRLFRPAPGCPSANASNARGWCSHEAMRAHLDDRCAGSLAGEVPQSYLSSRGFDRCSVCGLLVAGRYNRVHPRCKPEVRHEVGAPGTAPDGEAPEPSAPDMATVIAVDIPTQRHVPKTARSAWAQCFARAACEAAVRRQRGTPDSNHALARRQARCFSWAAEGKLSRACGALVDLEPVCIDDAATHKLLQKHPQTAPARPGLVSMGPPSRALVPDTSAEMVVGSARKFRSGSVPGPWAPRGPSPGGLEHPHGDEVAAHLTEVVRILAAGDGNHCPSHPLCADEPVNNADPGPRGQRVMARNQARNLITGTASPLGALVGPA